MILKHEGVIALIKPNADGTTRYVSVVYQDPSDSAKTIYATAHEKSQPLEGFKLGDIVSFIPAHRAGRPIVTDVAPLGRALDMETILSYLDQELAYNSNEVVTLNMTALIVKLIRTRDDIKQPADLYNYFWRSGLQYIGRKEDNFFFFRVDSLGLPSISLNGSTRGDVDV